MFVCTYIHICVWHVELHVHLCDEPSPKPSYYFLYSKRITYLISSNPEENIQVLSQFYKQRNKDLER